MAKKKSTTQEECDDSFEDSLNELEKIVTELESGKLGLSDALERYEYGVKHLKGCQRLLASAERKIELLSGVDAEGNPITQPFDESDTETLEGKSAARGRRRTSRAEPSSPKMAARERHRRATSAVLK